MPGPIDYRLMVDGLLGLIQPVGDVIPFQRRNPDLKMQTEMGARPYMGGGGGKILGQPKSSTHYPMRPAKPGEPLLPDRTPKVQNYDLAMAMQRYGKKYNLSPEQVRELVSIHGPDVLSR